MTELKQLEQIFSYLPPELEASLKRLSHLNRRRLREIRIYADAPVLLFLGTETVVLQRNGQVAAEPDEGSFILRQSVLEQIFKSLCRYSVHSFQEEIRRGFLTIEGGHRVGVFGTAVVENGQIHTMKDFSSLSIRVAREVLGAADAFYSSVYQNRLQSILVAGAPGTGKTTLVRDLVRGISSGRLGMVTKVAVVDERGELAAMHRGVPQNDLGFSTDVYALCPKAKGMEMALRAGSPQMLVCDEIGSEDDVPVLEQSMLAGVHVLATAHAGSFDQLVRKRSIKELLDHGIFDKVVLLQNNGIPCVISQIVDCKRMLEVVR